MQMFKLLSVLLDYPSDALLTELRRAVAGAWSARGLVEAIDSDKHFAAEEHLAIAEFLDKLLVMDNLDIQSRYVQTFDLTPEHSLHLTHHIFGEEKTRGPALIDLTEYLKSYGFTHDEKELPDYLPLLLEFAAQLDIDEARVFLADTAKVLKVIAEHLEQAGSPYAALLRIIKNHGSLIKLAA